MSSPAQPKPYWHLSAVYFFFFASVGVFMPYFGPYLKEQGLGAVAIGQLMAITLATKVVAPPVWGWLADHTGRRETVIRGAALLAWLCFAGVLAGSGYGWLALVLTLFSFFWNAALPLFEATTLNHLGHDTHLYSRIRLWGSIGFIVCVSLLGPWLERYGIGYLPAILLVVLVGLWIATLTTPASGAHPQIEFQGSLFRTVARPEVLSLLLMCFLLQASHGPYYSFFSIYLEELGYGRGLIGQLWALGVVAEVGVFLCMHRWLPRFGARRLLLAAAAVTALRWVLIAAFAEYLPVLLLAQAMHAGSFGLYHSSAIHLIHYFFPGRLQGRGQALYSSLSFGLGGAAGSVVSGYVWTGAGPVWIYLMAAGLAGLGLAVAWIGLRPFATARK